MAVNESSIRMATKEHIIDEIRRIAETLGRPPGQMLFSTETGIKRSEWRGVYWRSWSEALKDAGYQPNDKQTKFSSEEVLRRYAEATRHFQRIPAEVDIRMYSRDREDFPGHTTFINHFGSKAELLSEFSVWIRKNEEFGDLVDLFPETKPEYEEAETPKREGFVYLLRSGDHFKIGRSDELERRIKQISIALPNEVTLEHAIRTDDPPGIEAYWHRRFAERRTNGEWFHLTRSDIGAFKRRKFQ